MLLVKFKIGNEYYAINTDDIIEIVPALSFKTIPGTPSFFSGIFDYRGQLIPVIDITQLTLDKPSIIYLSTRVILLNFSFKNTKTILGLMAEDVTDVIDIPESAFQNTGITSQNAPYLGPVCKYEGIFIQLIQIDKLLSPDIQKKIFSLFEPELK